MLEVGIVGMLSLVGGPYGVPAQTTYLLLEEKVVDNFYVTYMNSTRNNIKRLNEFNPITTNWTVGGDWRSGGFTVGLGHTSEHNVGAKDGVGVESFDWVRAAYRVTYE